ncbi:MAG: nucleotidyl transferase AbiEii/AbiGii toxin family protein [Nitrospirota bacterium]
MVFNEAALIHDKESFTREALAVRLSELGFNNLARMELFLWDLEMFLQIQTVLQEKVVLKGGAAAQFYIPIEYQRTSVDIDIICIADTGEVKKALEGIEKRFNGEGRFFKFRLHTPKTLKTELPLLTYYMDIPSVCGMNEVFGGQAGVQEIKVEFFLLQETLVINSIAAPRIFALKTNRAYQVMPINALIGDKLTTLGAKTVGIPPERADEYIKQVYDTDALVAFNWKEVDFDKIKRHFIYRAGLEAEQRGISFGMAAILSDMTDQMDMLSAIDFEKNEGLKKLINDFQSLYLRKTVAKSMAEWAITGSRLGFFIRCLDGGAEGKKKMENVLVMEDLLKFDRVEGEERGKAIRRFCESFAVNFEKYSRWPAKMLKGKYPSRILWAVVSPANIEEISAWLKGYFKKG